MFIKREREEEREEVLAFRVPNTRLDFIQLQK